MKKSFYTLLIFATFLISISCSRASSEDSFLQNTSGGGGIAYGAARVRTEMSVSEASVIHDMLREEEASSESSILTNTERKLVKSANIRIRVDNLETADASIDELLNKYQAYSASTNIEENSRYYSLRVPAQYYEVFLSETSGMGRLLHRYESTEDVTLRYYDLEGRLETKKELIKVFQSYLGRANSIEEILAVEARIAELQYDIDGTGIQLRNLANRVDYATIDLSLLGPVMSTPSRGLTLAERIKQLFSGFGSFLSTIAVILIGIVIYGIPIILLTVFLFWLLFGKVGLVKKLFIRIK